MAVPAHERLDRAPDARGGSVLANAAHHRGRRPASPRSNLLAYYRDGDDYLVVASNGGANRNPAWYHNLRAHPKIDIFLGRRRLSVTAHIVMPDDPDYGRLWHICDSNNGGRYSSYQRGTTRPIGCAPDTLSVRL